MKTVNSFVLSALVFALVPLAACQRADEQTQKKLDLLISKVEGLEKKVAAAPAGRGAATGPAAAQPQRKRPDPAVTYYVPVTDADAVKGAKTSKVTIVEAFEFACPYCAMLVPPLEALVEKHPDVKLVSKQYVIHPDIATLPALAACAANKQGKYAPFEKQLWARSWPVEGGKPSFQREQLSAAALEKTAGDVGLDVARFKADRDGADCKAQLEKTRIELTQVGVTGTPAIYINGKPYQGPRTPEALSAAVEEAKKQADAVIAKGTASADSYYDSIMKGAQKQL